MSNDLLQQVKRVRDKAKDAIDNPEHYAFLPELIQYLDLIEAIIQQGKSHPRYAWKERQKLLGGFGRIATDQYSFSQSELGDEMIDVVNRFVEEQ